MKQIKPGRAPSMMSGIVGIFMVIIGIAWTIGAAGMGAPWFFCLFGVVWNSNRLDSYRFSDFPHIGIFIHIIPLILDCNIADTSRLFYLHQKNKIKANIRIKKKSSLLRGFLF